MVKSPFFVPIIILCLKFCLALLPHLIAVKSVEQGADLEKQGKCCGPVGGEGQF
jgi:hypothetical protein